jgi:hypothetical protein
MTHHHILFHCNRPITTFHVACASVIWKTRSPRGCDTCIRRRNLAAAVGRKHERHRLQRPSPPRCASKRREEERLEAPPPPASAPMAGRRVLLFLKPFDVYSPRPCAGASPSSPNTSPPMLPRAANPKVAPLSFSLSFLVRLDIASGGLE